MATNVEKPACTSSQMSHPNYSPFLKLNVSGKFYQVLKRNLGHRLHNDSTRSRLFSCAHNGCDSKPKRERSIADENEMFVDLTHQTRANSLSRLEQLVVATTNEERAGLCDLYCTDSGLCFFDRPSQLFDCILDLHRRGALHAPADICPQRFMQELHFWNIDPNCLSSCCSSRLGLAPVDPPENQSIFSTLDGDLANSPAANCKSNGAMTTKPHQHKNNIDLESLYDNKSLNTDNFDGVLLGNVRRVIWRFMEDPASSVGAKVFAFLSVAFVLASVMCLIVASLPEFEVYNEQKQRAEPLLVLIWIEIVCIIWFTGEYILRLILTTQRLKYIQSPLNIIDALSILPFYVELILEYNDINISNFSNIKGALLVMRILRVLRVARVFRLARYSGGMKSFGQTMKASYREIGMLVMFMSTTIILFSTTVYFLEKDVRNTPFVSIPATFWWCIVTMTTVGYGDLVPTTVGGKLVASLTSVSGVIVLAFPITIIVENFNKYYRADRQEAGGSVGGNGPQIKVHRFGI